MLSSRGPVVKTKSRSRRREPREPWEKAIARTMVEETLHKEWLTWDADAYSQLSVSVHARVPKVAVKKITTILSELLVHWSSLAPENHRTGSTQSPWEMLSLSYSWMSCSQFPSIIHISNDHLRNSLCSSENMPLNSFFLLLIPWA